MMVLITYDVNTETPEGKKRLRLVAKECENVGQRVQKSVFECLVDPAQFVALKHRLEKIIDKEHDSLRYYRLGANWQRRVEHVGANPGYDPEGFLHI
ncbi:MAG TPA: CRISPR-associated endonuclease Cas2 [Syntrophothermus lipocalidus]|uniref:CRISPR-associated endoribonuclease Cas2 n=1 Tax=Syntrophothermus lipocalidus (strain DSM 12680 / TGB-C1) TaxID=643648 RepID=D7CNM0_SYNLT|nr:MULTISPECIES: CRISPR-associated endonuclease Cas2 [Syntrophothermus]ADI02305.1 CRISPR-associated protein Cas2 [Syntrophothermus lipocalidus DSM 12680]NSW83328.1 CRISPR-associated endonuclease Cas2 [Syntrophothermus sp.]HHV76833.1 CRISPR-associated endonuclease Cas2 [Syntrophothermus lipocalidus]